MSCQNDKIHIYKTGTAHTHLEGYPKPLKEELGIEGPIDAAFVCGDHHIAHLIKGNNCHQNLEIKVQMSNDE